MSCYNDMEIGRSPGGDTDFGQYIANAIRSAEAGRHIRLLLHGKPVARIIPAQDDDGPGSKGWALDQARQAEEGLKAARKLAGLPPDTPEMPPGHIHDDDGTVEGCPGCFREPDVSWILRVIERVDAHLDAAAPWQFRENPMANRWRRVTKVCEESGEVWRALSAWDGENPRKGVSGTREDLLMELGDTACAALGAIQSITKDTRQTLEVFTAALAKALSRVPEEAR